MNNKDIITITLNPAYDVHCNINNFIPFSENYVSSSEYFLGGKGINISRSLLSADTLSTAVVLLGQDNCAAFEDGLKKESICYFPIYISGRIRENFTFHSPGQKETRISFDNFSCDEQVLNKIDIPKSTKAVAFAGRLPKGISKKKVTRFLKSIKEKGVFLCVDSNSFTLDDLMEISPDFIKPNEVEIKALSSKSLTEAAVMLYEKGIKNVLITNGGDNAVYMGSEGLKEIVVPKVAPISTVGAGDSTIAGFLSQFVLGSDVNTCIKTAIAFGSAATLKEGTTAPDKEDIKRLIKDVTIKDL